MCYLYLTENCLCLHLLVIICSNNYLSMIGDLLRKQVTRLLLEVKTIKREQDDLYS